VGVYKRGKAERSGRLLGACDWELPATRHGLNNDVRFFYAGGEELGFRTGEEGLDYCCRGGALIYFFSEAGEVGW
jgi:hypothetical protein